MRKEFNRLGSLVVLVLAPFSRVLVNNLRVARFHRAHLPTDTPLVVKAFGICWESEIELTAGTAGLVETPR